MSLSCLSVHLCLLSFFFFQAEDGIRDYKVTGVQTCALPISVLLDRRRRRLLLRHRRRGGDDERVGGRDLGDDPAHGRGREDRGHLERDGHARHHQPHDPLRLPRAGGGRRGHAGQPAEHRPLGLRPRLRRRVPRHRRGGVRLHARVREDEDAQALHRADVPPSARAAHGRPGRHGAARGAPAGARGRPRAHGRDGQGRHHARREPGQGVCGGGRPRRDHPRAAAGRRPRHSQGAAAGALAPRRARRPRHAAVERPLPGDGRQAPLRSARGHAGVSVRPELPPPPGPFAAQDGMPTTRGLNFYVADPNLEFLCSTVMEPDVLARARPLLVELGAVAGDELDALAAEADRHPPTLRAYDERGRRVDEVVFHPAYRAMERLAFERFGLAAMSHRDGVLGWPGRVPHVVKYTLSYLFAQSEFGLLCPVNMTDSTARMLTRFGDEALRGRYLPRLTATALEDLWQGTQWMTEKTGGSDVGALTTLARRDADGAWRLWGDKWFASNANADVALTLARPEGAPPGTRGLGLFLVPRHLPDGTKNAWTINRLKDKLGSRSMATGEVTYAGAVAYGVGDVGRGFAPLMAMVNGSRLSNAMRAAGIMRRSLREAGVHPRGPAAPRRGAVRQAAHA